MTKSTGVGRGGYAPRWRDDELAYLASRYPAESPEQMALALGRTRPAIYQRLAKLNLVVPRPSNYHPYFREIDSPAKAYVLGILAADGWIDDQGHIGIELNVKDQEAVEFVRDELCPGGRVRIYGRYGSGYGGQPRARFQVGSVGMAADLARLGIGPRKTRALIWPQGLPEGLDGSFVCGYFDGDGHMRQLGPYWTVCSGTAVFLEAMREHIGAATGVRTSRVYAQGGIWAISKYGEPVRVLDAWMHRDVPGLARKRIPSAVS